MTYADQAEDNPYEQLRDEMRAQMDALRVSFETYKTEKEQQIAELEQSNKDLQRALVRDAFTTVNQNTVTEPSEQDLYAQKILELSEKSLNLMKRR